MSGKDSVPFPNPRRNARRAYPKFRVLLALEGNGITPESIDAVLTHCARLTDRLDIIVVNPPAALTSPLKRLLLRLEHSGIDYRLVATDGVMADEVENYLHRFPGISTVIVDKLEALNIDQGDPLGQLRREGYDFISLADSLRHGPDEDGDARKDTRPRYAGV